ncbi:DUF2207 domain-containing protein [Galbitalea sp. SE-J8]|uniref:DUF2207 domain-containing protein n=1 Tax=Galbitalea sp. SE-J8 TaxID=3054952 RepID=UPI00259CE6F8|nr:DUF2207 domain-containing protein [Galbitalea sp. SE-J8]MDM4762192.1 DUF2207 domain-containing protein [Galbitalea sp. SE-J8]
MSRHSTSKKSGGGWFFVALVIGVIALIGFVDDDGGGSSDDGYSYASTDDFSFESLHTDYELTADESGRARLAVTETFVADFPDYDQNRGIVRAIPETADGRSLDVHVESVTDAADQPVAYEVDHSDGFTTVAVGTDEYVHGRTTYVIAYRMRDAIHAPVFSDGQEFTFDVNGTGWNQPFGEVSATLHVDPALARSVDGRTACFVGEQGSNDPCDITREGDSYSVDVTDLAEHENVTVVVGFAPGTFDVPISVPRLLVWILAALALLVLIAGIVVRIRRLGPPRGTGIIVPQYAAFPGIGVMEAAELLDERDRALPALVTELVVARAATLARDGDDYTLRLTDATALDDEDSAAARTLFGSIKPGTTVTLDHGDTKIGDRVTKLLGDARDSVRDQGLVARRHTRTSTALRAAGAAVAGLAVVLGAVLLVGDWGAGLFYLLCALALVLGVATVIVLAPPERPTEKAVPAYEHLLGIRDYLALAEADRIRVLQSPEGVETRAAPTGEQLVVLYEKLLPYAILFDIEDRWREVLGRQYATTPTDIEPAFSTLGAASFGRAFASTAFATTVASGSSGSSWSGSGGGSSFSGFSGGGFSGGGFGGGGGGGR